MRFHPQHGWIYEQAEVEAWGRHILAHINQVVADKKAIAHLDFEPEGE